jgi:mRNA interferase MazF
MPGGDAPKRSAVNVSPIATIDKAQLREQIGTLSRERIREVLRGINLLLEPRDAGG